MKVLKKLSFKQRLLGSIALGLIGVIIALPIVGEESNAQAVTLANLESRIVSHNLEVIRGNENAMIASYKKEKVEAKKNTGSTSIESEMNNKYYPVEAQMNLDYEIWNAVKIQRDTILAGKKLYMEYILLEKEIGLQNGKLIRLNEELALTKKQIQLGRLKASAQTTAELNIKKENFVLKQLMNNREKTFLDLNALLNYDLESTLTIEKVEIPFERYIVEDLNKVIDDLLKNQADLKKLKTEEALLSTKLTIYTNNNVSNRYDDEIIGIKEDLSAKTFDIRDKQLEVEYQVRSKYNGLLNAYDAVLIQELEITNAELTYNTLLKRKELGLETATTLNASKESLQFALFALEEAKLSYFNAVEEFKNYNLNN
jgi:hypothetical protein